MSSDSHATITYTSMLSYEVIVNGYFGMPMDTLDPYAHLFMEAPPLPDYIPGPEAPPSPDYIPGPKYPEYLPPADDVFPAEEQPLPAAVSPTAESPGYITDSEPEMDPEEEDGDDEKSMGDSIDYPTSRGDDDAADDGDDLSKDDADNEDEEESLDSKEEEEEHLAPTVLAPTLHSSTYASEDSDQTEPFEEGETAATPPPSAYLSPTSYPLPPFLMQLPIFTPLPPPPPIILPRTRASMVLMRSATPSTFILASLSRTPSIGTPPLLPIPLPTSLFPLPLLLPSTSCREGIPEADMPLWKKARFTTPTGRYKVGESSVAVAARSWTTTSHERFIPKMAPKRARTTKANPDPTRTTNATKPMTQKAINNLIAQRVTEALAEYETQRNNVVNGDTSHTTGTGPRTVRPTRECTYKDYLNYMPLKFNGTEGVIGLTRCALTWWNSHMRAVSQEVAYAMPWRTLRQMMTTKYYTRGKVKKLEVKLWNLKVKGTDITSYTLRFQKLALLCGRMFPDESDEIERYVGRLPEMIRRNVMSYDPKSTKKAIENQQNQQPFKRNNNVAQAYAAGSGEKKPYRGTKPLCPKCNFYHDGPCGPKCTNYKRTVHIARDCRSRAANTNNNNNNNYNIQKATSAYQGVPTCFECGAQGHFNNNCPKFRNINQGNQNHAGNGNAMARAYGVGTAGRNPDANVMTGTFLLNNRCASVLFDTGSDKSFMSTAFSSLININPSTLDYSYDVELADG
nr:hypothetical protein [Tanacetum cinerariifolium]